MLGQGGLLRNGLVEDDGGPPLEGPWGLESGWLDVMFYQRSGIGYDQPPSYQVVSDFGVVGEDDESGKEDDCCFNKGV